MATAPIVEDPAHVSASSDSHLQLNNVNHVEPDLPVVNGTGSSEDIENKRITNVGDQLNSADASVSGESDTEASRAEGSKQKDEEKPQDRAGSAVKKSATFKSVSVNRTFLAAKSSAGSVPLKTSDKAILGSSTPPSGSATLSVPRPRLVAKTGSGSSSIQRLSAANGGKPAVAPDPSVVWNKNKAPEIKKLTDEELKKFGIHMASRLHEDSAQGQNKWADIDDDDDDWAPDTITWGDGTKSTLPHPDEQLAPPSDNGSTASKERPQESLVPPMPSVPSVQYVPPVPAVLSGPTGPPTPKGNLGSGRGLVLKSGQQEKPNLLPKQPVPQASAKSPWASLPPVDRASPAAIGVPPVSRGPVNYAAPAQRMSPPPKESIAADDFSRSTWRDASSTTSRELYNSQSGKYEPAPDRRGSLRPEQPRHPAVLQRSQVSEDPAESSSAFQTNRTSQEVPYTRRRASSTISGGSGSHFQRLGRPSDGHMPPSELLGARRPSHASSGESPILSVNPPALAQASNRQQPASAWPPRSSPEANFSTPRRPSQPSALPTETNAGPTPVAVQPRENEIDFQKKLMREKTELARKRRLDLEAKEESERRARIQKKLESLGPAPEKKKSDKENVTKEPVPKPTQIQQREQPNVAPPTSPPAEKKQQQDVRDNISSQQVASEPTAEAVPAYKSGAQQTTPRRPSHGQKAGPPGVWAGSEPAPDRLASWTSAAPQPSHNVWGSPSTVNPGLGNGTFINPDILRISASSVPAAQNNKGPAPIGPPSSSRAASAQLQSQPQAPIGSRAPRYNNAPNSEMASKWVSGVAELDQKMNAARAAERTERERQMAERGLTIDDVQPVIKDTWRPVHLPGDGTRRVMSSMEPQLHGPGFWAASREDLAKGAQPDQAPAASSNPGVIGSGPGLVVSRAGQRASSQPRPSRFFPARDYMVDSNAATISSRPGSPAPPPPTMEGHPVYEGDVMHPLVLLPKPLPVVKLPPSMMEAQPSENTTNFPWATVTQFRPPVQAPQQMPPVPERTQDDWQNRINTLLNMRKAPPQKAMVVEPSSKNALDHAVQQYSATVSLPSLTAAVSSASEPHWLISKSMAEECFEEQEMGSLPQIRLPHKIPEAAWTPAQPHTKPLPRKFLVQATMAEPFFFAADVAGGGNIMKIQLPGMNEPKTVTVPFTGSRGGRGGHGRAGPRHRGSSHAPRGGAGKRERDTSGSYEGHGSSNTGRGGRGAYRSRASESWARPTASQPHQPSLST